MVSLKQDALLLSLRPFDSLKLVPEAGDRRTWSGIDRALAERLVARAAQALPLAPPRAWASDFQRYLETGEGPWPAHYTVARERLKALALGACVEGGDRFLRAAADQMYALCDECDWAFGQSAPDYPDFTHEFPDLDACETGALLAVSVALLSEGLDRLSPRIAERVRKALDERLTDPLINRPPEIWRLSRSDMPRAAAALMTAALLCERDDRRRWLSLRRILRMLEGYLRALPEDGGFEKGLEAHLAEAMAVNDCFSMLSAASGGEVELRDEPLFVRIAQSFVLAHIRDGWFVNPGGFSMRPDLSPDLLYRLGESARVQALCGLAAFLRRGRAEPLPPFEQATEPLLQQVTNALGRADLMAQSARSPRPESIELPDMRLMAGRMDEFYAALSGPAGGAAAAGDMTLFYKDQPVVIGLPGEGSVPRVNGRGQALGPGAQDAQQSGGPGYRMLSMNLAAAYPPQARLTSWQRTWMLAEFEGGVRLMEVFDLDGPGTVCFCFLLPGMPRVRPGEALLADGAVALSFDPALTAMVEGVPVSGAARAQWGEGVYRLTLKTPQNVPGGNYAFLFRPAAGEW